MLNRAKQITFTDYGWSFMAACVQNLDLSSDAHMEPRVTQDQDLQSQ